MRSLDPNKATKTGIWRNDLDFSFVPEHELLITSVITCDGESWDGHCGCVRSMSGIHTMKSTTVFYVDLITGEELKREYETCEYVREWSLSFENFKDLITFEGFPVEEGLRTIVQVTGDEKYDYHLVEIDNE